MADKGIIFSAPMVRALLDGRKTQTRRLLRNPEYYGCPTGDCPHDRQAECDAAMNALSAREKSFAVGDRLYVRERFRGAAGYDDIKPTDWGNKPIWYDADGEPDPKLWWHLSDKSRPSIHLPRWASRLTLTVTEVRVQRLQEISEADAIAEGIYFDKIGFTAGHVGIGGCNQEWSAAPIIAYANLWRKLHTKPGERWEDDPWVVAVSFDVRRGNIDAGGAAT